MMWWPWLPKQEIATTDGGTGRSPGCCERCGGYGMICLNGLTFLCWEHYREEMARQRTMHADTDPVVHIARELAPDLDRLIDAFLHNEMMLGGPHYVELSRFLWDNKVGILRVLQRAAEPQ